MKKEYYSGNRKNVIREMKNGSLAVFFSGDEIRRSADENYDFFGNRNFLYLTGIEEPGTGSSAWKRQCRSGMGKTVSSQTGCICRALDREENQRIRGCGKSGGRSIWLCGKF